jgi:hypothetical protein
MVKSSKVAWKIVPLRHFFPPKVVPLIEVLLYCDSHTRHSPEELTLAALPYQIRTTSASMHLKGLQLTVIISKTLKLDKSSK